MLTAEPTKEMIAEWQKLYNENRSNMKANRKTGIELDNYFCEKYDYQVLNDKNFEAVVRENILLNDYYKDKLGDDKGPLIKTYKVKDVYVGIDTESGYFQIESENMKLMEEIYNDLFLFRGLDECDLDNYFLVAEYVQISNK